MGKKLKKGFGVKFDPNYGGSTIQGMRLAKKVFPTKEEADAWARGCPVSWTTQVVKLRRKRR
jgi:hypothetical protein